MRDAIWVENHYRDIQAALTFLHRTLSWAEMAEDTGVSASTISKFARNGTRLPQFRTVLILADYADFTIDIRNKEMINMIRRHTKLQAVK